MTRESHFVRGELHVAGPGARRVPVRLEGRGRSLRIEVGAGWPVLTKLGNGRVTRHFASWLRSRGLSVTLSLRGRPVLELGREVDSGAKIRLLPALRALIDVPLRDLPRVMAVGLDLLRGAPDPVPVPVRSRRRPREARRG